MMIRILVAAAALTVAPSAPAQQTDWVKVRAEWNQPMAPFRILGNVHYVGTAGISAYLLTSPQGHILIDGGMAESAPLIAANIEKLGFKLADVKILLVNHAHWDHAGGLAELKRRTGARLLASAAEVPALESGRSDYRPDISISAPGVKVDGVLKDGEEIRLGTNTLVTHLTPGHTKGCTSFSTQIPSGGDSLTVLFACSLSVADQPLTPGHGYDAAPADFRATFAKLRATQADVFLSFHAQQFDLALKRAKQVAGDTEAFVDPGELRRRVDAAQAAFDAEMQRKTNR
ncbi:subclass B3 metallo-beta-lactamase [Sphingomonas sp. HT-1]|uniref:subclass B3 metallo-beta-lactamase n=1 Tax=unclassified Sphingomonas TaxID=196159 RepID=UPI0002F0AE3B|nr:MULTISPECIES: subclass B3 metallo-beta-lactamase [unclassified Sphingomonas]KTF69154.1 subclass B3 metallo-beta-lactamase [Sphingomonas sp. WG]